MDELHQDDMKKRMNSSYSSNCPFENIQRGNELNTSMLRCNDFFAFSGPRIRRRKRIKVESVATATSVHCRRLQIITKATETWR